MASSKHRVLVVEDEETIQKLIARALRQHGFACDVAEDGDQAARIAAQSQYDLVITDLKMPNKNGYSLVLELLQQVNRPLIVVLTGVVEPRLTKDLLMRGVDDFLFKPIDYAFLAAKVHAMVERRSRANNEGNDTVRQTQHAAVGPPLDDESTSTPINLSRLNSKITEISTVLSVSNAALDVYEMTRSDDWEVSQIGAALSRPRSTCCFASARSWGWRPRNSSPRWNAGSSRAESNCAADASRLIETPGKRPVAENH